MTQPPIMPGTPMPQPYLPVPPPPKRGMSGGTVTVLVLLGSFVLVGLMFAVCIGLNAIGGNAPNPLNPVIDAKNDVTITKCSTENGLLTADLHIVNSSSARSSYMVTISFEATDGTRLGEGIAAVTDLDPGQAADTRAVGMAENKAPDHCKIASVSRL